MIKQKVISLFRDNCFWIIYSMDKQRCDYIYKDGKICNAKIHIKCDINKGKFRCYDHVSKTVYTSEKRRNIDPNKICNGLREYGTRMIPCKELKKGNSNYCRHHHIPLSNPNMNTAYFKYYFNKLLYNDILQEHKLFLNNILLKEEIDLFHNINYDNNEYDLDYINIRYNSKICLNQNYNGSFICNNHIMKKEKYCFSCLNSILKRDNSFILKYNIEKNIENVIGSLKIQNRQTCINHIDNLKNKIENDFNYYLNNKFKRRKINYEVENKILRSNFSFKYTIMDYYINNIQKNNKNLLNNILKYIICIRNYIYKDHDYLYNKIYLKILFISDKMLKII